MTFLFSVRIFKQTVSTATGSVPAIKPLYAHPYYPQDKGKVERAIRSISEEFIYLLSKFTVWLKGKIKNYKRWFNNKRFHRGINNYPAKLFWGS